MTKLGASGKYPQGKYGSTDEGELTLAVSIDRYNNLRIDFGKPVAWLSMTREQAMEFGALILRRAKGGD